MPPTPEPSAQPVIEVLDNLVPPALHTAAWEACCASRWAFGHGSHDDDAAPFWLLDLNEDPAAAAIWEAIRERCQQLAGAPLRVLRVYANGHTYGLGGKAHHDDSRPGTFTLLYYPMPEWKPEWDGETVYFDADGEIALAVRPRPNRAVFFDSRILHEGRAPSRACVALRVTIAFKLEVCAAPPPEAAPLSPEAVEIRRDGAVRVYAVRLPAEAIEEAAGRKLADIGKTVRLPGFRPGNVPIEVLRERYGAKGRAGAVEQLAAEALEKAVPKGRVPGPVEWKSESGAAPIELHATVTVLADLPPPDLATLRVLRLTATDEELQSLEIPPDEARMRLREHLKMQVLDFLDSIYRFPVRRDLVETELSIIRKTAPSAEADPGLSAIAERRVRLGFVLAEMARRLRMPAGSGVEVEERVIDALVARAAVEERAASAEELRELL